MPLAASSLIPNSHPLGNAHENSSVNRPLNSAFKSIMFVLGFVAIAPNCGAGSNAVSVRGNAIELGKRANESAFESFEGKCLFVGCPLDASPRLDPGRLCCMAGVCRSSRKNRACSPHESCASNEHDCICEAVFEISRVQSSASVGPTKAPFGSALIDQRKNEA